MRLSVSHCHRVRSLASEPGSQKLIMAAARPEHFKSPAVTAAITTARWNWLPEFCAAAQDRTTLPLAF
jgi:hypothetical protein